MKEHSRPVVTAWGPKLALSGVCVLSLGLVTTANRGWYFFAQRFAPGAQWVAETCIVSLLLCSLVYLSIRPRRPFALPQRDTDWRRIIRVSTIWLAVWLGASFAAATHAGHWIAYTSGAASVAGFLFFGPLQEELLFRGAIFELAQRVFPRSPAFMPILISSIFFSLHHFELHHYHATRAALLQVGFTFPMGLVFGALRRDSDSVWPALGLHFLTNLPGCFGR